ncbi:MAG: 5-(carboxyamino)imidazole ribonucleotide synthase [Hyphomicrobiaceae bacterium]|nr:5-(carboxyamino)imidazole ribonucleotide synthase [Hyphomicrobiaceae bacterium]
MARDRKLPLPPGSTIGILGGGQLGRMLALAAARLGLRVHVYSDTTGPACDVAAATTIAPFEDLGAVRAFAEVVDVVTYEFENVPLGAAAAAGSACPVRPGPRALEVAQDRLVEKRFISGIGLDVAPFAAVDSLGDLEAGLATLGTPAILKTTRYGYDGKGQVRITSGVDPGWAREAIGAAPAVLEGFVPFASEASILVARGIDGALAYYDTPRNEHRDGILATSTVPGGLDPATEAAARDIGRAIAEALDYVGLLAVELFVVPVPGRRPRLVVNEIAPRVHNSGHWTLDACLVDQFENHVRAVAGWPLGATTRHSDVVMTNLIGAEVLAWAGLAAEDATGLHLYGKRDPRPKRKVGHVNRLYPKGSLPSVLLRPEGGQTTGGLISHAPSDEA